MYIIIMNKLYIMLNKYITKDVVGLVLKYNQFYLENILNIIKNNHEKFIIQDNNKMQLHLKNIIIGIISNHKLITISYIKNLKSIIKTHIVKLSPEMEYKGKTFGFDALLDYLNLISKNKIIKEYEINNNFFDILINIIKEYFVETYDISFTFKYCPINFDERPFFQIKEIPHNILDFFPNELCIKTKYYYDPQISIAIN
jgi:hypothetical protein